MSQTIVVKIGTSSLTNPATGELRLATIATLVESLCQLQQAGQRIVLVSSGAVGVGCLRLGLAERPTTIVEKQAVAAVGQGRLMRLYDDFFGVLGQPIAQVLLTRADLVHRDRYLNSLQTLKQLLDWNVIPIINENDTVATDELRFGDNDTLSALVAGMIEADWLILLTDVDRLYAADPRTNPDAEPIIRVEKGKPLLVQAGVGGRWGTGGMATKVAAAQIATAAGVTMVITHGERPQAIAKIIAGEAIGTRFDPEPQPERARKRWIAFSLVPEGGLSLDAGAVNAVYHQGRSLLPAGITAVTGDFEAGSAVRLLDPAGQEIARGLVNYGAAELRQISGRRTSDIPTILGYSGADTVVHRDNLMLLELL